jgi:hypothetical protein
MFCCEVLWQFGKSDWRRLACEVMQELHKLNNAEREYAAANAWRAMIYVRIRRVGNFFDDA